MNNYTLEKHLKSFSDVDKDYELLYSIWDLNKRNLTQGLSLVYSFFPHFSGHDFSHSLSLINNIQCFLGEERMRCLSATDTFLLLMGGLTHDIGMILTYKIIAREWEGNKLRSFLEQLASGSDSVLADEARALLQYQTEGIAAGVDNFKWALRIKNAVTIITAELFRRKHAKLSADNITTNGEFRKLADDFYSAQLPERFIDLLSSIAYLHGEPFDKVMSSLHEKAIGHKCDTIHPRFIACMIRLGDLLDVDNNRFNAYAIASIEKMPETSLLHQQKHAALKHLLISPDMIEVTLDCTNNDVYRISRSWFDWLEEEVNNQSREWSNIAPEKLGGLPPVISKNSIRILYNGIQERPEFLNLKFGMSQERIFSILQGGGIYKQPGFVFIREIVQNALDASKIQLWNDIERGYHAWYYGNATPEIAFPDDIPQDIYDRYPVTLKVSWQDDEKTHLIFECSDMGTGISDDVLLRMTNFVGESHKMDEGYNELYDKMPYWLRPTAAFGVGLQSVFFVTSSFIVETFCEGERSKRIVFCSSADNQYSYIEAMDVRKARGTSVKVIVPSERLSELLGRVSVHAYDGRKIEDASRLGEERFYLEKINHFVQETFAGIDGMPLNYSIGQRKGQCKRKKDKVKGSAAEDDFKCSHRYDYDNLVFNFIEKKFGSTFEIKFSKYIGFSSSYSQLFIRGILVSKEQDFGWVNNYLAFRWNLEGKETEQVVDISRDNLTTKGRRDVYKMLYGELLPQMFKIMGRVFVSEFKEVDDERKLESLKKQYLNYVLCSLAYRQSVNYKNHLDEVIIPVNVASLNKEGIAATRFLESNKLYLAHLNPDDYQDAYISSIKNRIYDNIEDLYVNMPFIWQVERFSCYLNANYVCTEIVLSDKEYELYKLERKKDGQAPKLVETHDNRCLMHLERGYYKSEYQLIYGLKNYPSIVVKLCQLTGYEKFPHCSSCCIISPFSEENPPFRLLNELRGMGAEDIKAHVEKYAKKIITPSLQEIVRKYCIKRNVTDEQILKEYTDLIYDYAMEKRK